MGMDILTDFDMHENDPVVEDENKDKKDDTK